MRRSIVVFQSAAIFAFAAFTASAGGAEELRAALCRDVKNLAVRSGTIPGCVVADGISAVPLAVGKANGVDVPVAAAAEYGKGRVVAVAHQSFFEGDAGARSGNAAFLRASIVWLAGGAPPKAMYICERRMGMKDAVERALKDCGADVPVKPLRRYDELASLPHGSVVIAMPDSFPPSEAKKLTLFVKNGGGVLAVAVGWGWKQLNPGKSFSSDNSFNAAFVPAGLYVGDELVYGGKDGLYKIADEESLVGGTVKSAMDIAAGGSAAKSVGAKCLFTLGVLEAALPPEESTWRPRLEGFRKSALSIAPSPSKPLEASNLSERLAFMLFQSAWLRDPEREWPASAAAAVYPGVPEKGTSRVTREVTVDLSVPRWHGTGLFAAAGEPFTVTLPDGAEKKGLRVRVGGTTCRLTSHGSWKRAPVVDIELPLKKRTTTFSTPFGGPIYVVVPRTSKESIRVKVGPACPMPRFVEGRDTPETWAEQLRFRPAPFAEIESERIVLIVPYSNAKSVADPRPLLKVWREIMDLDARLTGIPPKRASPERICLDVQLCAGYMHSGYPIMMPLGSGHHLVSEPTIREGKVDDVWGFFHEMGHNHQNGDWTFNGTSEVTVNFFTLYNMLKICGIPTAKTKIGTASMQENFRKWNEAGRPLDKWMSDPFLALNFFAHLIDKYGWDSFERLFAEYRALPPQERPKNDLEKRQQWCSRLSRIVGEDLTPEFQFLLSNQKSGN